MKRFKRVLSLALSLMMLLSVSSVLTTAHAANMVTIKVVGQYDQTGARSMLNMINNFRASNDAWYWNSDNKTKTNLKGKLQPYVYDYALERIAMQRAAEIAVECDDDHHRPNGEECWMAFEDEELIVSRAAENAAFSHSTAKEAFEGWQETNENYNGQGHRRSMLSDIYTAIGISHFVMNGVDFWIQVFHRGGFDAQYVNPNNSITAVPVEVLQSHFTRMALVSNNYDVYTAVDTTADMPTIRGSMFTQEHWPEHIYIDTQLTQSNIKWTIADRSIAVISNGKIKGVKAGDTTLTASYSVSSAVSASVTINIHVAGCDHKYSERILKPASCTEEGLLEKTCMKCGEIVTRTIPITEHRFDDDRVESTCLTQGTLTRTCEDCGVIYIIPLPLGDHQFEEARTEPTCQEKGQLVKTCTVCGLIEITPIPISDHQYETISEIPATCTERGTIVERCTMCGDERTQRTPMIAHDYTETRVEPTCTKEGKLIKTCTACGDVTEAVLPMTEHRYRTVRKEATCAEEGSITKTCEDCGHIEITKIDKKAHQYQEVSRVAATYDKAGNIKYECKVCHDSYTQTIAKKIRNGFFTINGKKYYYKNDKKLTGWQKLSNKWYYFNGSGVMLTGWQKLSNKWYYFNGSGVMLTGWQKLSGKWYYFNASGAMLTGWQKLGGKWYYFNSSGAMLTGWQKIGGTWYYFNSGGDMKTGWLKDGGSWYFFDNNGAMLTGTWRINGKSYTFNASGVCTNP